mgnify:CR=1 FL=1
MAKALFAVDELAGFIVACAKVRPDGVASLHLVERGCIRDVRVVTDPSLVVQGAVVTDVKLMSAHQPLHRGRVERLPQQLPVRLRCALPLQIVLHNAGADTVPDRYYREGIHYVTLARAGWQQVVWEIDPLPRDRVTRRTIEEVRRKFDYSYDRIQTPDAKELALPMLQQANARLAALATELSQDRESAASRGRPS